MRKVKTIVMPKTSPSSSNPSPVQSGGGFSKSKRKIKPIKGSFHHAFPELNPYSK